LFILPVFFLTAYGIFLAEFSHNSVCTTVYSVDVKHIVRLYMLLCIIIGLIIPIFTDIIIDIKINNIVYFQALLLVFLV